MSQVIWVLLKVFLQLLTLQQLLLEFFGPCFAHCSPSYRSQSIAHTVSEHIDLLHVKLVRLHFFPLLCLPFGDFLQDCFIVPGGSNACWFVLAIELFWDDKGQRHSGLPCSSRTTNSMCVCL